MAPQSSSGTLNSAAGTPASEEIDRLLAMLRAGRHADVEASARALIERNASAGFLWKVLGLALSRQGKDPLHALERAAQLSADDAEAHGNLGNALRAHRRFEEAVASQRRALAIKPDYAEAHNNLGSALLDLGRADEAVQCFRRAVELKPQLAMAHTNLANACKGLGWLDEAASSLRRAATLEPDSAVAHANLGMVLRLQNRRAEAEASCARALELNPELVAAILLLAKLHTDEGLFAEAEALYRRALSTEPESPEAWSGIAGLRRMTLNDAGWAAEAQRIASLRLPPRQEMHLRYAIGKYFDDVRDFPRAFDNYRRANELSKGRGSGHDRGELAEFVDRVMRSFDRERGSRPWRGANPSCRPVFIVGMPRSGTSLAEQFLASHPDLFGAGELPFWGTALSASLAALRSADIENTLGALAADYLQRLDELSGAARVVDKMPANFLALGLIHAALPNARIIHMRRNAIDTCLSIYFQDFEAAYSYANDLGDLAHAYREYERLMRHWRSVMGESAILDVSYEGLVEEPETWGRRMLDFIGLPWDARCLDFHQTRRTVSTVSGWQVRQRIHTSSVERWRNYEPFIGPLLDLAERSDAAGVAPVAAARS